MIRARQYAILLNACIMIPILIIIIVLLDYFRRNGHSCGIPVQIWVELVFIVALIFTLLNLNELWIMRCNRAAVIPYTLISAAVLLLIYSILVIWGYVIYYSDDNNCQDYSDTSAFLVIMIILLFIGLFVLLAVCLLLICGPILYCQYRDALRRPGKFEGEGQIAQAIDRLQRSQYNPATMTAETTCAICQEDFKRGDQVTQLKCNEAHLFHTDCIVEWISRGENTCPLCRAPIDNVDELRAMMEGGECEQLLGDSDERRNRQQDSDSSRVNNRRNSETKSTGQRKRGKKE